MARSATVPNANQSEADVLDERAAAWNHRPLLRDIYHGYFAEMVSHLATRGAGDYGKVVELGGGSGNFREYFPGVIATDLVPTPHVHAAVDAMELPFADNSIDNLIMQDVLHHLPYPLAFFREAQRVLRPGGRIVLMEPYISWASRVVFKLAHPEPVVMGARIFGEAGEADSAVFEGNGAFASNQAIPTLLFFRDLRKFEARFGSLTVRVRALRSLVVYPMSGGFSGPQVIPNAWVPLGWWLEQKVAFLGPWMAFRLLVVVEKRG